MSRGKGLKVAAKRLHKLRGRERTTGVTVQEIQEMQTLEHRIDRLSMPKGWQEKSDAEHERRMAILDDVLQRLKQF